MSTATRSHQAQITTAKQRSAKSITGGVSRAAHWSAVVQRAQAAPETLTSTDVLTLQRSIGNRATVGLLSRHTGLQGKLKLGPAGDKYEQEADRVAAQVTRQMAAPQAVQRQSPEEEELQMKPLAATVTPVQRKTFQKSMAQRKGVHGPEGGEVESSVAQQIGAARGGGKPLDDTVRAKMERGFGADFSGVRVHTGGQADTLNRSLNAKAFTVGKDVFFGKGQYNPGSSGGQKLIAHELTHTVQQGASPSVQRAPEWWEKRKRKKAEKKQKKRLEQQGTQTQVETPSPNKVSFSGVALPHANRAMQKATTGKSKIEQVLSQRTNSIDMDDPETARARETKLMKSMVKRGQRADAAVKLFGDKIQADVREKFEEILNLHEQVKQDAQVDNLEQAAWAKADQMDQIADQIVAMADSLENDLNNEDAKARMMTGKEFKEGSQNLDWESVELSASDAAMAIEQNKFKILNYYSFLQADHARIGDHVNKKAILLTEKEWGGANVVRQALASGLARGQQAGANGKAKPLTDSATRLLLQSSKQDGSGDFHARQGYEMGQFGQDTIEQPVAPQGKGNKYIDPSLRVGKGVGAKKVLKGAGQGILDLGATAGEAIAHPFTKNLYEKTIKRGSEGKKEIRHLRLIQGLELMALFQVQSELRMQNAQQYLQDTETKHQTALNNYDTIDKAKKANEAKAKKEREQSVPSGLIQGTGNAWKAVTDTGIYRSTLKQYKLDVLDESKKYEKFGERAMVATGRKIRTAIGGVLGGTVLNLLTGGLYRIEKKNIGGGYDVEFEGKSFVDDFVAAAHDYVRLTTSVKGGHVRGLGGKRGAKAYGVLQIIAKALGLLKSICSSIALFTLPLPPVSGAYASIALFAGMVKAALELLLMIWAGIAAKKTKDPRSRGYLKGKIAEHGLQFGTDMTTVVTAGVMAGVSGDPGQFMGKTVKGLFEEGGKYGGLISNKVLSMGADQGVKQGATILNAIGSGIGTGVNDENVRNMALNQQVSDDSVKEAQGQTQKSKDWMAKINSGFEIALRKIGGGPGKGHGKRVTKRLEKIKPQLDLVRNATQGLNEQVQNL
ncbi:MAG: DUF4157 domain-containing protein [Caldilineaceae bacterium]|nr:DUF4157 domain-containing protein [Caldilineaceae bacterium]